MKSRLCLCLMIWWKECLFYTKLLDMCKVMEQKIPLLTNWTIDFLKEMDGLWRSINSNVSVVEENMNWGFEILILGKVLNPSKCNKYRMISIRRDKTCLSENCILLMKLLVLIQILPMWCRKVWNRRLC